MKPLLSMLLVIVADKIAKRDPIEEIKYAYKLFSANSPHGKIGLADLQKINETLGCRLSDEEMHGMIEEFDIDQDGFSKARSTIIPINNSRHLKNGNTIKY